MQSARDAFRESWDISTSTTFQQS